MDVRIYRLSQAPYYRVDGLSASANTRENKENTQVKHKLAKKGEQKKTWQDEEDTSIVVYA